MTQIDCEPEGLAIRFPGWESLMTGREVAYLPYRVILAAWVEPGWTSEVLGMRSGLVVSGFRKLGTFTHPSGVRRLVAMKRGLPLLRLRVDRGEAGFEEILLSTDETGSIARLFQEVAQL